jgi:FkbM family methyltransferase
MHISALARHAVERATRNWVYRRRLPQVVGGASIYVTPSAGLKYLFRPMTQIDPPLLQNAIDLVRRDDVVWDIGANVGLFAFAAAACAGAKGSVIAIEPDTFLVDCLRRSALLRAETSAAVAVVAAAVGSEISLREFTIASRSRASNAMRGYGQTVMGAPSERQTVVTVNLDWLASNLPPPNLIKCDVEGAEAEVFAGQTKILNEIRPVIICEVSANAATQMATLLLENGYALYDGERPLAPNTRTDRPSWNTIAIPEELTDQYLTGR